MSGVPIIAAVLAAAALAYAQGFRTRGLRKDARLALAIGLALIAAALYLAWRAGGGVA